MRCSLISMLVLVATLLLPYSLFAQTPENGEPAAETDITTQQSAEAQVIRSNKLSVRQQLAEVDIEMLSPRERRHYERLLNSKDYFDKGYFGYASYITGLSILPISTSYGVEVVNGYNWRWFGLGVGIGARYHHGLTGPNIVTPVYLNLRAEPLNRKVTPVIVLNLGYAHGFEVDSIDKSHAEGILELPIVGGMFVSEIKFGIGIRLANSYMLDILASYHVCIGEAADLGGRLTFGFRW